MREKLEFEEADIYEMPVLAEAGGYAEVTEGAFGWVWDGFANFFRP
ncbi:lasso RiPP family leader peptide-containing protein [Streptomyces sp. NPDC017988]